MPNVHKFIRQFTKSTALAKRPNQTDLPFYVRSVQRAFQNMPKKEVAECTLHNLHADFHSIPHFFDWHEIYIYTDVKQRDLICIRLAEQLATCWVTATRTTLEPNHNN